MSLANLPYIPHARDCVVGHVDHLGWVRCRDCSPPTEYPYAGNIYDDETCKGCGLHFGSYSAAIQRDHDMQQAEWAKMARPTVLIEYGIPTAIRCRVY